MQPSLILASGSPRRRDALVGLGLTFTVRSVEIDESPLPGEDPTIYVLRLARAKAHEQAHEGELVLAADTIVSLEGDLLGKPGSSEEAKDMLRRLSGRQHSVATGIALYEPATGRTESAVETSQVRFATMSEEEISWYVDTGEPMDKAGSYAIQGFGALFVKAIEGNYSNIVGLPLSTTYRLFADMGFDLKTF
ncbi:MAG: Maf family protein [Deltaproteobacteria bacterium]|nr:Maf family protein [Deltaproteobacteria bacterium]